MTISLNKIKFYAYHGVLPQERTVGADYEVTLSVEIPYPTDACEHDLLDGTVNYAMLYDIVRHEMSIPSKLLEHVACRTLKRIRSTFPIVESATIRLTKVNPPIGAVCEGASVELTL